ncbi:hypothetical protein HDV63DRAFT_361829 [Trichoderma sp. SZMC 28014]
MAGQRQGEVPPTCRSSTPSRLLKALGPPHLLSSCQLFGLALCHCRSHIPVISSISALPSFLKTSLIHDHGFQSNHQESNSFKSPRRPIATLCSLFASSVVAHLYRPGWSTSPISPFLSKHCLRLLPFPSLSRISHSSSRASTTLGDFVACFEGTP